MTLALQPRRNRAVMRAGFSRDQALGIARAIRDHASETLATTADLRELELRLEARFAQLGQKIADAQFGLMKGFTAS